MKKIFFAMITVFMLIVNTPQNAYALQLNRLESVELTAGEKFYISYDVTSRNINLFDYEIIGKYADGSTKPLANYRRYQVVFTDGHAIVKIASADKTYAFRITLISNADNAESFKITSTSESTCIAKYDCSSGIQSLTADSLSCDVTYSDGETQAIPMNISGNTAISLDNSFCMTLDNALIFKNNYSADDNSTFYIASFADNEQPSPPENEPVLEKYAFNGWYADKKCENLFDFSQPLTESTVIYAGWRYNMRSVTVVNGAESGEYQVGSEVTVTADKIIGKEFICWQSDLSDLIINNEYEETASFIMPDCDITITASYIKCWHENTVFTADDEKTHSGTCICGEQIVKEHQFVLQEYGNEAFFVCRECGYRYKNSGNEDSKNQNNDNKPSNSENNTATPTDGNNGTHKSELIYDKDDVLSEQLHAQSMNTGDVKEIRYIYFALLVLSAAVLLILIFGKRLKRTVDKSE